MKPGKFAASNKKKKAEMAYEQSMSIGQAVWSTPDSEVSAYSKLKAGNMFEDDYRDHIQALSESKGQDRDQSTPFDRTRNAAANWNRDNACQTIEDVMTKIMIEENKPNKEQERFLRHFVARLKLEVLEMLKRSTNEAKLEPLLDLIHGFPGTGKSAVIAWMRRLMEEGLGWEHGVQFVCLAFQNAMAAQINGYTIHHWSGIPVTTNDGSGTGDRHKQSIKCQALRVVIIDEVSMISAELLGALECMIRGAVRKQGTYKKRQNGETRAFGGVNIIMCGDFWQLQPVLGIYLASDFTCVAEGRAQRAMELFWNDNQDSIRSFWQLTEVMRCKDAWYNAFLSECRNGNLSLEKYCYFHGLPTFSSPCQTCNCNADQIDDPLLGKVKNSWKEAFLSGITNIAEVIKTTEGKCQQCTAERKRRHRVLSDLSNIAPELHAPPYSNAPALYNFNVPRYFSMQLRAREYAKQNNVQLTWCYARDVPLHPGDRELRKEALDAKLYSWLRKHDQQTSHIPSLYALAKGMPIRLTESVDRETQLYRGRRGVIYGWTMSPEAIPVEFNGEFIMDHLPSVIYLHFPEATWKIGKLPAGVYPLRPRSRTWKVNKYTGIEARRTGYWFVPDFGSTVQGQNLQLFARRSRRCCM